MASQSHSIVCVQPRKVGQDPCTAMGFVRGRIYPPYAYYVNESTSRAFRSVATASRCRAEPPKAIPPHVCDTKQWSTLTDMRRNPLRGFRPTSVNPPYARSNESFIPAGHNG